MRRIMILFIGVFLCLGTNAQTCIVSGEITNATDTTLSLDLLFAGAHFRNQSVDVLVRHGKFTNEIKLPYPVFALFKAYGQERRVLLMPSRNLHFVLDAKNPENIQLKGKAAEENTLLYQLKIGEMPFFVKDEEAQNKYARMPMDSLQQEVVVRTHNECAEADAQITKSTIPDNLKNILSKEVHYVNQCYLYDFAQNYMRWVKNKEQEAFLARVMHVEPLPDSATLVSCLFANMMLSNYCSYELINAGKDIKKDSAGGKAVIEQLFRMPFPEIMQQAKKYGERYMLTWLYAKYNLAPSVRDKILFNNIMEGCHNKLYTIATLLQDTLQHYFPNSHYLTMAKAEVNKMKEVLKKESDNQKIVFHPGTTVQSFKALTDLYKDKVIYLDIWGTWCGPCREEMRNAPALKKRYADKDIVFVYLDMDEDNKENDWKEMARIYGLEGHHYRMDNEKIQALWKEIEQEGGNTNRYPTYVLFDKNGKMLQANAARPSDGEKLYAQIDILLK
ncbi:MAG: TlpA disulfide reductase family protein [Agriterribacter sp.]